VAAPAIEVTRINGLPTNAMQLRGNYFMDSTLDVADFA
jgi:hypothetical protein